MVPAVQVSDCLVFYAGFGNISSIVWMLMQYSQTPLKLGYNFSLKNNRYVVEKRYDGNLHGRLTPFPFYYFFMLYRCIYILHHIT